MSNNFNRQKMNLLTQTKNTWCPGCTNFGILAAFKGAIEDLVKNNEIKTEEVVVGSGIGCHGKISDYLNLNSFCGLHGRIVPVLSGAKIANPNLKVIAFEGDGDGYAEGIEHLVHAAKRNIDLTLIVHDNQTFALTTGQFTPTSPKGFKGKSTPEGSPEEPFNPLFLMLSAGATFIARSYALEVKKTQEIIKEAIRHKGFSFIEIIQPCLSLNDTRDHYQKRIYWLNESRQKDNIDFAFEKIREWNDKVPLGIFYQINKKTYGDFN